MQDILYSYIFKLLSSLTLYGMFDDCLIEKIKNIINFLSLKKFEI
jgi:hypothetical protein